MDTFKVHVVDDDLRVLTALEWLLKSVQISVETYSDPFQFLRVVEKIEPGCILLDVRMPGISGMRVLEMIMEKNIRNPVMMISGHGDISMAVRALKLGAHDFITKPFNDQNLLDKLENIRLKRIHRIPHQDIQFVEKLYDSLTARERQILGYIVSGKSNKEIGQEIGIALSTVEMHRSKVMKKMQSENLAQLLKKALVLDL